MPSTPQFSRKFLIIGAGAGLLAFATGCAKSDARGASGAAGPAASAPAAHDWSYAGAEGPENWGNLSSSFRQCQSGKAQSPVDLPSATRAASDHLAVGYQRAKCEVTNKGHSVELHSLSPQKITVGGTPWTFKQMHFHAPSEHTLAGVRFEAEFHFVHESDDGGLAVVGVFAKAGKTNAAWTPLVEAAAAASGAGETAAVGMIDFPALLPDSLDHFGYDGSLTTPPCSENVRWMVLEAPIELGGGQLTALRAAHSGNARPTQPLHGRRISRADQ